MIQKFQQHMEGRWQIHRKIISNIIQESLITQKKAGLRGEKILIRWESKLFFALMYAVLIERQIMMQWEVLNTKQFLMKI